MTSAPLPNATAVREQLIRILQSSVFRTSTRLSRLLAHLVESTIKGRTDLLEEFALAMDVFDRKADFDPKLDPVVRVSSGRLRAKLRKYYDTAGRDDELWIELPRASYVPVCRERPARPPRLRAVAVLVFETPGEHPIEPWLGAALADEVVTALSRLNALRVAMYVPGPDANLRGLHAIGMELGVDAVLTGSIAQFGETLRVRVMLVEVSTGLQLWTDEYAVRVSDIPKVYSSVAERVCTALSRSAECKETFRAAVATVDSEAYKLFLAARHQFFLQTEAALHKSILLLQQAISIDPAYALAFTGLAEAYALLGENGFSAPASVLPLGKAAAFRSLELAPRLPEAYMAVGMYQCLAWDWEAAETSLRMAGAVGSMTPLLRARLCCLLASLGRLAESAALARSGLERDPVSIADMLALARTLYLQREFEEAEEHYLSLLEIAPSFVLAPWDLSIVYARQRKFADGQEMLDVAARLLDNQTPVKATRALLNAIAGQQEHCVQQLTELEQVRKKQHVSSVALAQIHCALGDVNRALDWLEAGLREKDVRLFFLKTEPAYDVLRHEERFQCLMREVRLI